MRAGDVIPQVATLTRRLAGLRGTFAPTPPRIRRRNFDINQRLMRARGANATPYEVSAMLSRRVAGYIVKTGHAFPVAILLAGLVVHYLALGLLEARAVATFALIIATLCAGAATAWTELSGSRWWPASVGVAAAFLFGIADTVYGWAGNYTASWPGPLNSLLAALLALPIAIALAMVGGVVGSRVRSASLMRRPDV